MSRAPLLEIIWLRKLIRTPNYMQLHKRRKHEIVRLTQCRINTKSVRQANTEAGNYRFIQHQAEGALLKAFVLHSKLIITTNREDNAMVKPSNQVFLTSPSS